MGPSQTFRARNKLVDARIVFHGAGAQRVKAEVDRVVVSREPGEVANRLHFADFGEVLDFRTDIAGPENGRGIDRGNVEIGQLVADLPGRAGLKQKWFVLCGVLSDFANHFAASAS